MRGLRVLGVLLALIALPRTPVWACSCVTAPASASLARSAVVFTGTARLVQPQGGGVVTATFTVERVLKGSVPEEVTVFTGAGADDCGIAFTEKRPYTVFASAKAGALVTGLCDGTTEGDAFASAQPSRGPAAPSTLAPEAPKDVQPVAAAVPRDANATSRSLPIAAATFLACCVTVGIVRRLSAA